MNAKTTNKFMTTITLYIYCFYMANINLSKNPLRNYELLARLAAPIIENNQKTIHK